MSRGLGDVYKRQNIHDFFPRLYKEKHVNAVANFNYDKFPAHETEKCFLVSHSSRIINVKTTISFYYDFMDDLKLCIDLKKEDKRMVTFIKSFDNEDLPNIKRKSPLKKKLLSYNPQSSFNSSVGDKNSMSSFLSTKKNFLVSIFDTTYILEK